MTHGSRAATNARLTASTLARHECCAEQRRHDRTSSVPTLSKFERFGYLPLNLWLTWYEGMQATSHLKEMPYGFSVSKAVAVSLECGQFNLARFAQHAEQTRSTFIDL